MATWRIKGYVSDSEDEDDISDFNPSEKVNNNDLIVHNEPGEVTATTPGEGSSGTLNPPNRDLPSPARSSRSQDPKPQLPVSAIALEKTLNDGLAIVRDVLSQHPAPTDVLHPEDDTESPLSTPPESPVIPPLEPTFESTSNAVSPPQTVNVFRAQRNLRERNAAQQNPYTVERASYMLLMARSGQRPIRDVDTLKRSKQVEESQESTFEESSQALNSPEIDSMDVELLRDDQNFGELPSASLVDDPLSWPSVGEELPDVEYLFNRHSPKRHTDQKAIGSTNVDAGQNLKNLQTPRNLVAQNRRPMKLGKRSKSGISVDQQNSIPSPPRSTSATSIELLGSPGVQSQIQSPLLLPTPVLSSGLRRKRLVIEDDTQSLSAGEATPIQSDMSESDVSEGEKSGSEQLRVMQRKIKGVLPASWWSIGRLQEDLNRKKRRNENTAAISRSEVGVAQRKSKPSPNRNNGGVSRSTVLEDLASEESDNEVDRNPENRHRQTSLPAWTPQQSPRPKSRDEEASEMMDEDLVDPMLPTYSRHGSFRRKRQIDLRDVMLISRTKTHKKHGSTHRSAATNEERSRSSRKKPRRKTLSRDLGILDAPDILTSRRADLPDFLRVAARQARQAARIRRSPKPSSKAPNPSRYTNSIRTPRTDAFKERDRPAVPPTRHTNIPKAISRSTEHSPDHQRQTLVADTLTQAKVPPAVQDNTDEQNAQLLRLTRLRSLLPFKNRSGNGRLVSKPFLPRNAQFEEIQPLLSLLPRRAPRPAVNPLASDQISTSHEITQINPQPAPRPVKVIPKRKKRTPIKNKDIQQTILVRQEPADRHLRLAFENNDPNLRQLLHAEFNDYQTAWFQGRKLGDLCATPSTQHHFDVFLEVLTAYLSIAAQDVDDSHDARDLNSFLHRLLPNRGEIGTQGQIGDKVFEVLEQDVLVARNVFDLYVCLVNLAPGCAPRLSVLEMMVNFTQAHHEICKIALSAWEAIYKYHHIDTRITRGLTNWMYSILAQLIARWLAAESDARFDAKKANDRVAESLVRKVIDLNRTQACELLCQVQKVLEASIRTATSVTEANSLLDIQSYLKHLDGVSRHTEMTDDVFKSVLYVAKSYLEMWKRWQPATTTLALLSGTRQTVASLTSGVKDLSQSMQKTLMEAYFLFAQASVEQRQKHWDDFIEPTSSFNLNMFVSQKYLQNMRTLFFHFIVEKDTEQYCLEFRALILNHWILVLFQHRENNFAELLTFVILKNERESLAMPRLASSVLDSNDSASTDSIHQSLPEIRHRTVAHIIPYLYEQEHNPEGEWLVGGLEDADSVSLLRTMFSTMKEAWMSLNEKPEEQDLYTLLIHFALDQYETYPRSDFKIEPWFFNSATFPQRRKHTLSKILQRCETSNSNMREAREVFQNEVSHARRFQRFAQLEEDLKEMLVPRPREDVPIHADDGKVWVVHAAFIREAFPDVLLSGKSEASPERAMILRLLVDILTNLECRLSKFELNLIGPFIATMDTIVDALANAMHSWNDDDRSKAFIITASIFEWTSSMVNETSQSFLESVEAVCDMAGDDDSDEALELLQTVITRR